MATTNLMANSISPQALTSKLRDYYTLTKPEVNLLILMTTSAGYYLASRGPFRIAGLVNTLIGTLPRPPAEPQLSISGWNGCGIVKCTAPQPDLCLSGRLSAREAFLFGILLSVAGGPLPCDYSEPVIGVSRSLNAAVLPPHLYALKRKTPLCTLLGAFPGAMPTRSDGLGRPPASTGKPDPLRFSSCGSSRIFWRLR